jgi:hypothetical protein
MLNVLLLSYSQLVGYSETIPPTDDPNLASHKSRKTVLSATWRQSDLEEDVRQAPSH